MMFKMKLLTYYLWNECVLLTYLDSKTLSDHYLITRMRITDESTKRAATHSALTTALKSLNEVIQKASRLRYGGAKAEVITHCRAAVQAGSPAALAAAFALGPKPAAAPEIGDVAAWIRTLPGRTASLAEAGAGGGAAPATGPLGING